uniref:Ig-like domain-containing protein n=1 Tax=Amphiprion percula TaxID=161767 RepID=A0A3P8SMY8_AMPPE
VCRRHTVVHCKGEDKVMQPSGDVIAAEGDTVTLDCTFETTASNPYLFWYKQVQHGLPKYILRRDTYGENNAAEFQKDRFDAELNKPSVPLKIQKLHLSDSVVYYCALQPTVTGNSKTLYKNLWNDETTVCLATGFSRHNATSNHTDYSEEFKKTEAGRISSPDPALYNQVIFPTDNGEQCEGEVVCSKCFLGLIFVMWLFSDPMVNGVSFTILVLRVIFLKTVVFDILMTMRLWISQCEYRTTRVTPTSI